MEHMDSHEDDCCSFDDFAPVHVGRPVPDFTLEAYHKGAFTKVSLSDYQGKWKLLFFYPLDFTFVCPTEIIELSNRAKEFEDLNTQVLLASIDSIHSHKAWSKEIGELHFPMLSDLNKELSLMFNVLHDDGMSLRGAFIIDQDNVLQASIIHNLPVGRNVDELKRVIEAFQTGDLCPINWSKGKGTLGKA